MLKKLSNTNLWTLHSIFTDWLHIQSVYIKIIFRDILRMNARIILQIQHEIILYVCKYSLKDQKISENTVENH